ncbi:DUF5071 domain-containing protein [Alkaliphilus transvaalensis]|uniref:DUF5071 domain-containing protein n=1 Tax=Alkaliphilus transvaalensis TaxID=114628 RepID=UPI000478EC87|nr:DUF5071 domain-containing protein [Alkaliphilus transvaalensis]
MLIKELIADLDWGKPREIQENAIRRLKEIDDEDIVLLAKQSNDICHKGCWQNAALVLKLIDYPRIKPALPYIMQWFQDINWPEVYTIIEILRDAKPFELIPYIEEASKRAIIDEDGLWALGIVFLLEKLELNHKINSDIYNQLVCLSND